MFSQTKAGHTFVATSPFTRAYRKKPDPADAPRCAPPRKPDGLPPAVRKKTRRPGGTTALWWGETLHTPPEESPPVVPAAPHRKEPALPPRRTARRPVARFAPGKAPVSPQNPVAARVCPPRRNARRSARAAPTCRPAKPAPPAAARGKNPAPAHRHPHPPRAVPRRKVCRRPVGRVRRPPFSRFALVKSVLGEGGSDPYRPPAGDRRPLSREFSRNCRPGVSAPKRKKAPPGAE